MPHGVPYSIPTKKDNKTFFMVELTRDIPYPSSVFEIYVSLWPLDKFLHLNLNLYKIQYDARHLFFILSNDILNTIHILYGILIYFEKLAINPTLIVSFSLWVTNDN